MHVSQYGCSLQHLRCVAALASAGSSSEEALVAVMGSPAPSRQGTAASVPQLVGSITVGNRGDKRGQNTRTFCAPLDAC